MTQNELRNENAGFWMKYRIFIIAVIVMIGFMLPPVKKVLNTVPYLWEVLYPLLALFSLYVLIQVIQAKEGIINTIKWALLLVASAFMALAVFDVGSVFYTLGRTTAIIFIVMEMGTFLYESVARNAVD